MVLSFKSAFLVLVIVTIYFIENSYVPHLTGYMEFALFAFDILMLKWVNSPSIYKMSPNDLIKTSRMKKIY